MTPSYTARMQDAVILVTGGTGFIGDALCRALAASGSRVVSVSRRAGISNTSVQYSQVDLADADATRNLVRSVQPDYVFHLASYVTGQTGVEHVLPSLSANLLTTVHLMLALQESACRRMVLAGSLVEPDIGSNERVPTSPYSAAKWASSDYARMFHSLYKLPVAIARIFMVYGPGQDTSKLIPYVITSAMRGERPRISSGRRQIDWVYVDDVVRGLMQLVQAPGVDGRTVDLGSGTLTTTTELVQRVCRLVGTGIDAEFASIPDRPNEPLRVARVTETRQLIGWAPEVDLDSGLARTLAWFRDR
jgi:UDP-glucose 4-epimerase